MSNEHLSNSKFDPKGRFTGLAEIYAKARPTYPKKAIDFIIKHCHLSGDSLVADVGCGTGISSRLIAERGINVIGIDPNEDMLSQARTENESDQIESLVYSLGSAEETGLKDASVDAVLAAQAFHWFRPEPTLHEFCRILKKEGYCVLMWNERDDKDAFTNEYTKVLRTLPNTATVEVTRGTAGDALLQSPLFQNTEKVLFSNEQLMDESGLLGRAFSASYAPKNGELADWLRKSLIDLFAKHQQNGKVVMKYETSVYVGQRK